jgi:hypothetical protein
MDMAAGHLGRILQHLRRAVPPPADGVPDEQLLERFAGRRDEAAFEALVRRHGPMVFGDVGAAGREVAERRVPGDAPE